MGGPAVDRRFEALSSAAQVHRLRAAALEALREYQIEVSRLRLVYHGYNTTFRVDTVDGSTYALRLNVNSRKTAAELRAEMAWLDALARDTDLSVPVPQHTIDGALSTSVLVPSLERALPAALFGWLKGPDVQGRALPAHLRAAGRAMATLHAHAQGWSLPADSTLPASDDVFMHGVVHLRAPHPLLTPDRRALLDEAVEHVQQRYRAAFASASPHVLHADLHLANMKWYRGRLSVFDFDDCVIGVPAHDLAVSTYYLRFHDGLVDALCEGYAEVSALPTVPDDWFEALVAGRNVLLVNELLGTSSADFRELLPRYMANSMIKLRHYLDTGRFRHDLPGVVPLD